MKQDKICSYNEISGIGDKDLIPGLDFRKPEFRRNVFLEFYGFHLKYKSHPGAVYYVIPFLSEKYNWDIEDKLWFAFINGATQNPLTSWVLFKHFPKFSEVNLEEMEIWHRKYWRNLDYDIDRRYQKGHFVEMVENYKEILDTDTQEAFFSKICNTGNREKNFDKLWDKVFNDFFMYGRLSTFSYLEYLKIVGVDIDCSNLFIYDKAGSKSHRNGLCIVNGRDDLDVRKDNEKLPKEMEKGHTKEVMSWLEKEGKILLSQAKEKFKDESFFEDVNYFTLESTLCCYKSWHRQNRRYPNVYNDMFYDRIKKAETRDWGEIDGSDIDFQDFWEARKKYLPKELRLEDNPDDPGLDKVKQNWYKKTGEVIMMDIYNPVFKNSFKKENIIEMNEEWYSALPKRYNTKQQNKPKNKSGEWL